MKFSSLTEEILILFDFSGHLLLRHKSDTISYKIDSGDGPLDQENEVCKSRNYRDTKYFSDLLRIMSERTRNFSVSRW